MDLAEQEQDAQAFAATVARVQAYVRQEPGAWSRLAESARSDPEGTTRALLSLGTVLLDIAAGAFTLSPDEVLQKVASSIEGSEDDELRRMAQQ